MTTLKAAGLSVMYLLGFLILFRVVETSYKAVTTRVHDPNVYHERT